MATEAVMTAPELTQFVRDAFPDRPVTYVVDEVSPGRTVTRMPAEGLMLRPGGTVSGPSLMAIADSAAWVATLAEIGPVAMAVTSHLSIHFLRRPQPGDLVATTEILRRGRRQAVIEVRITTGEAPEPVAVATVTYAIPGEAHS